MGMIFVDSDDDDDGAAVRYTEELEALSETLRYVEGTGAEGPQDWLHHGHRGLFPLPGLVLPELGDLALPLTAHGAKDLRRICARATRPGQWSFAVNASSTSSLSPSWSRMVREVVEDVARGLGVPPTTAIVAEPSKLTLVDEHAGGVDPEEVREEVPGMFAKLTFTLPSRARGGELAVRDPFDGIQSRRVPLGNEHAEASGHDPLGLSYGAFYVGCQVAVGRVTSGSRLFFSYRLCVGAGIPRPLPSEDVVSYRVVASAVSEFLELKQCKRVKYTREERRVPFLNKYEDGFSSVKLVCMLEGRYEALGLAFGVLGGRDRGLAEVLGRYCAEHATEVSLYLCHVQYTHGPMTTHATIQNPWIKAGDGTPFFYGDDDADAGSEIVPARFFDEQAFDYSRRVNGGDDDHDDEEQEERITTRAALVVLPITRELELQARLPIDRGVLRLRGLMHAGQLGHARVFASALFARLHKWACDSALFGSSLTAVVELNDARLLVQLVKTLPTLQYHGSLVRALQARLLTNSDLEALLAHGRSLGLRSRIALARMLAAACRTTAAASLPRRVVDMVVAGGVGTSPKRTREDDDRRAWRAPKVPTDEQPPIEELVAFFELAAGENDDEENDEDAGHPGAGLLARALRVDVPAVETLIPAFLSVAEARWARGRLPWVLGAAVDDGLVRITRTLGGLGRCALTDLSGLNAGCCRDCATLDGFLRGPLEDLVLSVGRVRRKHIHRVLNHVAPTRVSHRTDPQNALRIHKHPVHGADSAEYRALRRRLEALRPADGPGYHQRRQPRASAAVSPSPPASSSSSSSPTSQPPTQRRVVLWS